MKLQHTDKKGVPVCLFWDPPGAFDIKKNHIKQFEYKIMEAFNLEI